MSSPAFPVTTFGGNGSSGLTKRELFAAMAMQGLLSADQSWRHYKDQAAEAACTCADALITALAKGATR